MFSRLSHLGPNYDLDFFQNQIVHAVLETDPIKRYRGETKCSTSHFFLLAFFILPLLFFEIVRRVFFFSGLVVAFAELAFLRPFIFLPCFLPFFSSFFSFLPFFSPSYPSYCFFSFLPFFFSSFSISSLMKFLIPPLPREFYPIYRSNASHAFLNSFY